MAVGPPTCPAEGSGCGDDEWEGEFFPGIPSIKYEVIFSISWYKFIVFLRHQVGNVFPNALCICKL